MSTIMRFQSKVCAGLQLHWSWSAGNAKAFFIKKIDSVHTLSTKAVKHRANGLSWFHFSAKRLLQF